MNKQTQTKMFDFSDADLDFCAGSKNLFPDRFKKMLALGYNSKVVSSVLVAGDQVILDYGVNHGYVADRVLAINTQGLVGEFYIDSATTNTVTITVANAPALIAGGFITKVAPLGWELVYELNNIHIYKMKHIDDTTRYVRFCFQDNATHRNAIAVCIGKSFDVTTGFINDPMALQSTASIATPNIANLPRWDGYSSGSTHNNYTYSQGYATFGKAMVVGSAYHFVMLACFGEVYPLHIYGIFPCVCHDYEALDYPVLVTRYCSTNTSGSGEGSYGNFYSDGYAAVGSIRVRFNNIISTNTTLIDYPRSFGSVLSVALDSFNTTTAMPLEIFEWSSSQHLGYCYGVYSCMYANNSAAPTISRTNLPLITQDIDFGSNIIIGQSGSNGIKDRATYLAFPIEEVKLGH